jgi:hypothetical protein
MGATRQPGAPGEDSPTGSAHRMVAVRGVVVVRGVVAVRRVVEPREDG